MRSLLHGTEIEQIERMRANGSVRPSHEGNGRATCGLIDLSMLGIPACGAVLMNRQWLIIELWRLREAESFSHTHKILPMGLC